MSDPSGRDMREARELSVPQQALPSFSSIAPAPPSGSEKLSTISAIVEGKKFLSERLYNPKAFKIWINIGMAAARQDYLATEKKDRSSAMMTNRRIFECLDASTEKNLDKIADKESAWKLLEACDWEDGVTKEQPKAGNDLGKSKGKGGRGKGALKEMEKENKAREEKRGADEKVDKDLKSLESGQRVAEKERWEKKSKESRLEDREDEILRDEAWRYQRDQDREVEVNEDDLP